MYIYREFLQGFYFKTQTNRNSMIFRKTQELHKQNVFMENITIHYCGTPVHRKIQIFLEKTNISAR